MKTLHIILSVLLAVFLSASLAPPASVDASSDDAPLTITDASKSKSKPVLIKIKNKANSYVVVILDHRTEAHDYTFSAAPGTNQYWVYSGGYNYHYTACGKSVHGHKTFNKGTSLTITCPKG
ncbi:MAG: hypothetical protein ACOYYU_13175 [Chloroflexota bacterium]